MADNVFITGSTGFLGRNMLELLLKTTNHNFFLLVRSAASKNSITSLFKWANQSRINFVTGDLTLPRFGLSNEDINKVLSCQDFWHFAAATSFDDRQKDSIVTTNIEGTKNILALAEANKKLEHLYFISTAYIAGRNKGVIYEDIMPQRSGFKNSYEESKYEAELLVRNSDTPWTIFRPSIVVGSSKNYSCQGETRMIYGYVLGIYTALIKHFKSEEAFINTWHNKTFPDVNIRLKGCYDTKKNFVCIDDVTGMINDIIKNDCIGKTYHLTSNNIKGEDISSAFESGFRVNGLKYFNSRITNPSKIEILLQRLTAPFDEYCLEQDPEWDTSNTDKSLIKHKKIGMNKDLFENIINYFIENKIINAWSDQNKKSG